MEERLEAGKDSKVEKRCKPPAIPTAPSIIPADAQSGREKGERCYFHYTNNDSSPFVMAAHPSLPTDIISFSQSLQEKSISALHPTEAEAQEG